MLDADQLAKNTSAAALYYFRGYDYDDLEKTVCYSSVSVVVARFGHLFGVISLVSTCFFFKATRGGSTRQTSAGPLKTRFLV